MATILAEQSSTTELEIRKMPDGGYIVGDGYRGDNSWRQLNFASSSIDEALKYIKGKLEGETK